MAIKDIGSKLDELSKGSAGPVLVTNADLTDPLLTSVKEDSDIFTGEEIEVAGLGGLAGKSAGVVKRAMDNAFHNFGEDVGKVYESGDIPLERPEKPLADLPEGEVMPSAEFQQTINPESVVDAPAGQLLNDQVDEFVNQMKDIPDAEVDQLSTRPRDVGGGRLSPETIRTDEDLVRHMNEMKAKYDTVTEKISYEDVLARARAEGWTDSDLETLVNTSKKMIADESEMAKFMYIRLDIAKASKDARDKYYEAVKNNSPDVDELKLAHLRAEAYEALTIRGFKGKAQDVSRTLGIINAEMMPGETAASRVESIMANSGGQDALRAYLLAKDSAGFNSKKSEYLSNLFYNLMTKGKPAATRIKDMAHYSFINNALTGVDTFARIFIGTGALATLEAASKPFAMAAGQVRVAKGKVLGKKLGAYQRPDGTVDLSMEPPISLREAAIQYAVLGKTMKDFWVGLKRSWVANKQFIGNSRTETPNERNPFEIDIPDDANQFDVAMRKGIRYAGVATSWPTRGIMGIDEGLKTATIRIKLSSLATRKGQETYNMILRGGGTREDAAKEAQNVFNDILEYPTEEIWQEAVDSADRLALTSELTGVNKALQNLVDAIPTGRTISPFVTSPLNGITRSLEYFPVINRMSKDARDAYAKGGVAKDEVQGRIGLGLMLGAAVGSLIDTGDEDQEWGFTGGMMYDQTEKTRRIAMGERPFSIWKKKSLFSDEEMAQLKAYGIPMSEDKVYFPMTGFEPATAIIGTYATVAEYLLNNEDKEFNAEMVSALVQGYASMLADAPMLAGVGNIFEAGAYAESNEKLMAMAAEYAKTLTNAAILSTPYGYGQGMANYINRQLDPQVYQRTATGLAGEDYSDLSPVFRSIADGIHQHRLRFSSWTADDGTPIPKKYNLMTGEEILREESTAQSLGPIRPSTRETFVGWNPVIRAGVDFPYRGPRKIEGVPLGGDQIEMWERAFSREPIRDEDGDFVYGGLTYGEELARLAMDEEFMAKFEYPDKEVQQEAIDDVRDVINDAKNSAQYYLMEADPRFRFDLEEALMQKENSKELLRQKGKKQLIPVQ